MINKKTLRYSLFGILALSVVLRIGAAVYMGNQVVELPGTADQVSYHALALRVIGGFGFTFGQDWWPATRAGEPTAHWSYLYTLYLAAVYGVAGANPIVARLLQAIIVGLLQPYLAYKIGSRIFRPEIGLAAAFQTAIYIYFVYYAGALMTEPFFITAILGCFYLAVLIASPGNENRGSLHWGQAAALGLVMAVVVLLRQLFMLIVPFFLVWLVWARRKDAGFTKFGYAILPVIILAGAIIPFSIFNYQRFHHFVLLNTNSGFAFYWANHPYQGTSFIPILSEEEYRKLLPQDKLYLDEAALDQELLREGLQFVKDDPGRYLLLSLSRIGPYFQFWPTANSGLISNISRVFSFGIFWPFMLYGLIRAYIDRKRGFLDGLASPAFLLFMFSVVYSVIHILTWTLIRYRLPVDALLLEFAALGLVDLYNRVQVRVKSASTRRV